MKKLFTLLIVFFTVLILPTLNWQYLSNTETNLTSDQLIALNKIIQLYEIRVEAAEIELKSDRVKLKYAIVRYDRLKKIFDRNKAVSESQVLEAKSDVDMCFVEVEADDNMIRESKLQLELIKLGVHAGSVNLEDIRIPTEMLHHR